MQTVETLMQSWEGCTNKAKMSSTFKGHEPGTVLSQKREDGTVSIWKEKVKSFLKMLRSYGRKH